MNRVGFCVFGNMDFSDDISLGDAGGSEDLTYLEIPAFLRVSSDKTGISKADVHEPVLLRSIKDEDLSKELIKILLNSGICLIGDLVQMSEYELQNNPEISDKMIDEIKEFISSLGYTFGMKLDNWSAD